MIQSILLADHTRRYPFDVADSTMTTYLHDHLNLSPESMVKFGEPNHFSDIYFAVGCYMVRSVTRNAPQFKTEVVRATTTQSLFEYLAEFHGADFAHKVKVQFMSSAYPRF